MSISMLRINVLYEYYEALPNFLMDFLLQKETEVEIQKIM
jgi:hypothetical protein